MRFLPRELFLPLAAVLALSLLACSDDDSGPTGPRSDLAVRDTLLTQSWDEGELGAMAYDPMSDHLFLLQDVHGGENVIHRWSFRRQELREVSRYTSQHDYGMRVLDGELWIARTYDQAFRRLGDLDRNELVLVDEHSFAHGGPATEVGDVARLGADVLFVASNLLTSDQPDGIEVLEGPGFDSVREMLSEAEAGWEPLSGAAYRSIVVLDASAGARVAVATGASPGAIVVYDTDGNEQFRAEGLGRSYLQGDSQGRLYAVAAPDAVVRWSPDFDSREAFPFDLPNRSLRFVLRETTQHVEFIYGGFRSSTTEVGRIRLPR